MASVRPIPVRGVLRLTFLGARVRSAQHQEPQPRSRLGGNRAFPNKTRENKAAVPRSAPRGALCGNGPVSTDAAGRVSPSEKRDGKMGADVRRHPASVLAALMP